ncbi:GntR family transcriptional regulator [Pseudomonas typographi]|uniref:GntR family transcriptional regulator n=1 Tax=Pseudomonas typographi TaxID=2715964 RepID=A0ABR7Z3N8_9PSED|nr:GntR family transcriptional regulator [Pseudomonas typographi]MBD1552678.1 GntR family transcriptional regulator [Pseudomonas typographi]MBD1588159.1 GntR family transcriptional regulator [Pseudomonas typographi]MBD1600130.1 GntR family transcriptional regulator [Pseudomonas typographi]
MSPIDKPHGAVVTKRAGQTVNDVYRRLKEMVILFQIRPEERVNESELANALGVSRTPLREALHRLVAENMLTMVPNRGFYGRKLQRQEVFDLYELRAALERSALALALGRASDQAIAELRGAWTAVMANAQHLSTLELVREDEHFHVRLAQLSGNQEMANALDAINARIRFFRWIDLEERREALYDDHLAILDALAQRDAPACAALIEEHISQRMEDIVSFIQAGVLRLYATQ